MSNLAACRGCLSVDVKLYSIQDNLMSVAFRIATGLSVVGSDILPQFLCGSCCSIVHQCISFRKQCLMSQDKIKLLANSGKLTLSSIKSIVKKPSGWLSQSKVISTQYSPNEPQETKNVHIVTGEKRLGTDSSHNHNNIQIKVEIQDESSIDSAPKLTDSEQLASQEKQDLERLEDVSMPMTCHTNTLRVSILENEDSMDHIEETNETDYVIENEHVEKLYECKQCSELFQCQSSLTEHIIEHATEKRFKCEACDETFSSKTNLFLHNKKHTGKKLFTETFT